MLSELNYGKKAVGRKQSQRAILEGKAQKVFLAEDAEASILAELTALCQTAGIPVEQTGSMQELGHACGIQVGAAAAVLLKNTEAS